MPFAQQQVQTLSAQAYEFARDTSEIYFGEDVVVVASAAAPVLPPLQRKDTTFIVALGVNMTIPTLLNPRVGMRVLFVFAASGVFTVTYPGNFAFSANGAAAANQVGATAFVWNGTKWVQEAGALTFK